MRAYVQIAVVIIALTLVAPAGAQETTTKRDMQGPVTVAITLLAPPAAGTPIKARLVLDTHSVGLDGIAFEQAVAMRTADGAEVAPKVEQVKGSGHHREAVLVFPAPATPGPVRLVVRNVGGVAERTFVWE